MASKKLKLKRKIKDSEREIDLLEKKRVRSQAALLEAVLNNVEPYAADVEFFKTYSALIDVERENMSKLNEQLYLLNKKKSREEI